MCNCGKRSCKKCCSRKTECCESRLVIRPICCEPICCETKCCEVEICRPLCNLGFENRFLENCNPCNPVCNPINSCAGITTLIPIPLSITVVGTTLAINFSNYKQNYGLYFLFGATPTTLLQPASVAPFAPSLSVSIPTGALYFTVQYVCGGLYSNPTAVAAIP